MQVRIKSYETNIPHIYNGNDKENIDIKTTISYLQMILDAESLILIIYPLSFIHS